jgi:hypothetical protein
LLPSCTPHPSSVSAAVRLIESPCLKNGYHVNPLEPLSELPVHDDGAKCKIEWSDVKYKEYSHEIIVSYRSGTNRANSQDYYRKGILRFQTTYTPSAHR